MKKTVFSYKKEAVSKVVDFGEDNEQELNDTLTFSVDENNGKIGSLLSILKKRGYLLVNFGESADVQTFKLVESVNRSVTGTVKDGIRLVTLKDDSPLYISAVSDILDKISEICQSQDTVRIVYVPYDAVENSVSMEWSGYISGIVISA